MADEMKPLMLTITITPDRLLHISHPSLPREILADILKTAHEIVSGSEPESQKLVVPD